MNSTARNQVPADPLEIEKLAKLAGFHDSAMFLEKIDSVTSKIRERFEHYFGSSD
jgi:glutamine synthetase adenylyltransferase